MNQQGDFWLGFSMSPGIGPKTFGQLLRNFGSAKKAWTAEGSKLENILKPALTSKFLNFRKNFDLEKYKKQLRQQKISFITQVDKEYPKLLRQIPNPPIVLYIKGDPKLLDIKSRKIAIVGTRHITSYGRQITEMFAGELAHSGLVIVSGMALGVDGVAHSSCIDVGGKTIAVLGNGVDTPYPRENEKLYEQILDSGGLILSEYPPGTPPSAGSFPARNRIVAGLSSGILVTEGAADSGSLITANFGLEFGRKVFAVPGPITSSLSKAPLDLIAKGARLVTSPEDILKEFSISNSQFSNKTKNTKFKTENKEEQEILKILENESLQFDEIARKTKIDSSKLGSILSMMEIRGMIKSTESGNFSIAAKI
ncbi:MAG: DNA-processing protein DprA [Candidatus Levyibacteriota bacterium]